MSRKVRLKASAKNKLVAGYVNHITMVDRSRDVIRGDVIWWILGAETVKNISGEICGQAREDVFRVA